MPPIEKYSSTWANDHCLSQSSSGFLQHIFYQWSHPSMGRWGDFSQFVCQSHSYFQAMISVEAAQWLPLDRGPSQWVVRRTAFLFCLTPVCCPLGWLIHLAICLKVSFRPKSLDLSAINTKFLGMNWNSRYGYSLWVQRPWQEII